MPRGPEVAWDGLYQMIYVAVTCGRGYRNRGSRGGRHRRGRGIGRALARGLAAAGARVVVNDLNFEAATAVAQEIGGYPRPGDVGTEKGVRELVADAREYLGEVDIYCSNAGIAAAPARTRRTQPGSSPGRST